MSQILQAIALDKICRVLCALRHEEADKVPKGELQIHDELVEALLGGHMGDSFEAHVKVRDLLCIDLVNTGLSGGPKVERIGSTSEGYAVYRDWLGNEWVESGQTMNYLKNALHEEEDLESFQMPDVSLYNADSVSRWARETDLCVFAQVGGVFDSIYPMIGFNNYVRALYAYPKALTHVIEEVHRFNLEVIRMYAEAGAHVILVGDDLAYDSGPFIPPHLLRKYVFPYLSEEAKKAHDLGLPAILHTDGNITSLVGEIADAGFDGLHSLQPSCGVDIVRIKKDWGERLCLMGNVDLDTLLTLGRPEQVEREVRRLIRDVAPGGGYILSTTNVLTRYTPPENALAMYRAAEKYGQYPIRLP